MSLDVPPWLSGPPPGEKPKPRYKAATQWKDPERWAHEDLAGKGAVDLAVEIAEAERALAVARRGLSRAWLQQRIHECRRELRTR